MPMYGGVEAGGTKFVCIISSGPGDIRAEKKFPTTTPTETLRLVVDFFTENIKKIDEPISSIGIACFGPIDLNRSSPKFGFITTTPKIGWKDTDIAGIIGNELSLPVFMDTDVNAAAVGEGVWGAGRGLNDFLYLTIGTGLGGGGCANGKPIHGLVHPEMGHMRIPHDWHTDPFPGNCPYHGDCLEGLAAGPAIKARWGQPAETLPSDHRAWEIESDYLALAIQNLVCILSPQKVILGGGVMEQSHLFPMIRSKVQKYLNEYLQSEEITRDIEHFIVPPVLGSRAGVFGAIALAKGS
jgi:fructokinase